ncbi:MAG: signal peptidase II [Acetatifactor sp.]|nr:signal peptidase II [Acetatifactor sp.]
MTLAVCLGIMGAIFLGDLLVKNYIERTGVEGGTRELLRGKILLKKYHNRGMMLNLGQRKRQVVAGISLMIVVIALPLFVITLGQRGNPLLRVGFSLLLGGAFSNTYDRLCRKYVVDYLSFGVRWKWFRKIVFNLSDFCIIIGAIMITLGAM